MGGVTDESGTKGLVELVGWVGDIVEVVSGLVEPEGRMDGPVELEFKLKLVDGANNPTKLVDGTEV